VAAIPSMPRERSHPMRGGDGGHGCHYPQGCVDLLCLLRLSEIALAGPKPKAGLRAMVDELHRLAPVNCSIVALPDRDGARLRYVAHAGLPGRPAHQSFNGEVTAFAAQAMGTRQIVQLAAADLMALVLLDGGAPPAGSRDALRLTPRQGDVLYELVERGASNEQIAASLGLSARTVKVHLRAVYRQLGVRRRAEAIQLVLTRHRGWLARERERRQGGGALS
jgi:DNA-binding CsgD family transcriptional regulator